mmetsp:Transcript_38266/g.89558  ORF Transcript_38266/g.89558 Transcript_38266/m.89558 type:complete len:211 (-) Transcript_38266:699-1331(-)
MALTNSASESVPEAFSSILTNRSRNSSSLAGGVEKAITSMATFLMLSALANSSKLATMSECCWISSRGVFPPPRTPAMFLIQGWASACDALSLFFGSFCMSCKQKSLACGVMRSHSALLKRTGSFWIILFFSLRSWWWKGRFPESSMYAHTPMAHMSTDESYAFEKSAHSSGDMYDGVPICSHIHSLPGATSAAKPKSMSLSSASSRSSS